MTDFVCCWLLACIWSERTLKYQFTRPLLEGRIGRGGAPLEVPWAKEPRFRRVWRVSSAL